MSTLPAEILHKIFIQLDLKQRLRCSLVCRSWWSVLDRLSLYYNVTLKQNSTQFIDMLLMFELLPNRANQVEEICVKPHAKINRLFDTFPNARVMKVEPSTLTKKIRANPIQRRVPISQTRSRVEVLLDIGNCELTSQLIYSELGGRLETLCLNLSMLTDTPLVLLQLKNMPVLKKLLLESPTMTLHNLEKIHNNVPSIQELYLHKIELNNSKNDPPLNVAPAACIKKFSFRDGTFQTRTTHAQFYQYITKKYANVTSTDYEDHKLSKFGFRNDDARQLYLNGVLDFFRLIGPNQSNLDIYGLPDGVDPFEPLDAVGSQIKRMHFRNCQGGTIYQHLSQSNQANYLQKLHVLSKNIGSILPLASLTALTTLTLHSLSDADQPLQFADCLAACPPSLKHLTVENTNMEYGPFETKLENIETVKIRCKTLSKHLGDIISTCFPNLVKLDVFGMIPHAINIKLESPRLQRAIFKTDGFTLENCPSYGFAFKSPNYLQTQYYSCRKSKKTRIKQQQSMPHLRVLSIESLTEKRLQVSDGSIYIGPY